MKNKIFVISLILTIIACIPILFVGTSQLYGFLSELNYYILSPFCFPTLILMPWVYNNKKLYWWYILLFPLAWNIFFIYYFFDGKPSSYISIIFFFIGVLASLYLKKALKK